MDQVIDAKFLQLKHYRAQVRAENFRVSVILHFVLVCLLWRREGGEGRGRERRGEERGGEGRRGEERGRRGEGRESKQLSKQASFCSYQYKV
jgi:hypothetical protein